MILSSLIILMLSFSVVSAAVENGENNIINDNSGASKNGIQVNLITEYNKYTKQIDVKVIDGDEKGIENVTVELNIHSNSTGKIVKLVNGTTDSSGWVTFDVSDLKPDYYYAHICVNDEKYESDVADEEFLIKKQAKLTIAYSEKTKKVSSHVTDKDTGKALKNVNVELTIHSYTTGKLVELANGKTNSKGDVSFDVSDLKPDKYYAKVLVNDKNYESDVTEMDITIKKHDQKQDKKINNETTDPIDMDNTGIPILGLVLVLFAILGIGYRKQ